MQTEKARETVVRPFEPGAGFRFFTKIGNAFVRPLLRSSAGRSMRELAMICFDGRRTGRRYEVPVGYHEIDGEPLVLTASAWKVNLRGGVDVEYVHEGVCTPMRAELVEDPDEVARVYDELLRRDGLEEAKPTKLGLKVEGDRMPTCAEIAAAVGGTRAVVRLHRR